MQVKGYMIVWNEEMKTWVAHGKTGFHLFKTWEEAKAFALAMDAKNG